MTELLLAMVVFFINKKYKDLTKQVQKNDLKM